MGNTAVIWEENGLVCVIDDVRWAVKEGIDPKTGLRELHSVIIPAEKPAENSKPSSRGKDHAMRQVTEVPQAIPQQLSVTSLPLCEVCGEPVPGKREDRRFCPPKCRQAASRGRQLDFAGLR
jgi:hypothetical protein